jgi:hypothetical protein
MSIAKPLNTRTAGTHIQLTNWISNILLTTDLVGVADFEAAIHNAVTRVWPSCEFKACRFYLGQSWWRKIQSLGLSKQYGEKDSEVSQILKKIFGLSLLPPAEVSDFFAFDFISHLPNDRRVEQFCDCLLEHYIHADSTFPPPVWSERSASSYRTTKAYESFHAHFNALFYSAHPNIFILISVLQKYRMRPTSKWEASLHEDLKNYQRSRKRISYLQRFDSTSLTWFRDSNLLHQCHIHFYQTQTYSSLSPSLFMPLATSVSVHITMHVKLIGACGPQWAKRFEVGP